MFSVSKYAASLSEIGLFHAFRGDQGPSDAVGDITKVAVNIQHFWKDT